MSTAGPLPSAIDAEQSLLGGLLIDPDQFEAVEREVGTEDFYRPDHARLFGLLKGMRVAGDAIDAITIADRILSGGQAESYGGYAYVMDLSSKVPSRAHLVQYARIVREKALRRRVIKAAEKVLESARTSDEPVGALLGRAAHQFVEIAETEVARDWEQVSSIVDRELVALQERSKSGRSAAAVTTGFSSLDDILLGFHPSQLIILAARPGMGKTALGLNLAYNGAVHSTPRRAVGFFSLEMDRAEIVARLLSMTGNVEGYKIRKAHLDDGDWKALDVADKQLREARIFVDDRPGATVDDLRVRARRLAALQPDLGLIVVDYLQLIQATDPRANRVNQVGDISRGLKLMAKELRVPVLALSQLSRDIEKRKAEEQRPRLSDLRDSGSIEQDADVILFIHRDTGQGVEEGRADVLVAKQRAGRTGDVPLVFLKSTAKFEEVAMGGHRL